MLQARLIVHGIVQGVGYRAFASMLARTLGINGKAKNLKDGTVEIVCECEDEKKLDEFKRLLDRKSCLISVEKIELAEKRRIGKPEFSSFSVEH